MRTFAPRRLARDLSKGQDDLTVTLAKKEEVTLWAKEAFQVEVTVEAPSPVSFPIKFTTKIPSLQDSFEVTSVLYDDPSEFMVEVTHSPHLSPEVIRSFYIQVQVICSSNLGSEVVLALFITMPVNY